MVSMPPAPMLLHRQQSRSSGTGTGRDSRVVSSTSCSTPTTISPSSNSPPHSLHDSSSPKSTLKSLLLTSFPFRDSFAAITNSHSHGNNNSNNNSPMSRPARSMQRSHSVSHAGVTHTVPALGQGATIVRTPADATSCMAQPTVNTNGSPWPYRQHSLRDAPTRPARRPSATPTSPSGYKPSDPSPRSPHARPPMLPEIDPASLQSIASFNDVGARHARNMSVDPRDPRTRTGDRDREPRNRQADLDAEYLRRQASRTSNATITPRRDTPTAATITGTTTARNDYTNTHSDHQFGTPTHHQDQHSHPPTQARYAPPAPQMQRSQSQKNVSRTLHTSHSNPHIHQPFVHPAGDSGPRGDPRDLRDPRDWQRMHANGSHVHASNSSNGSTGSTGSTGFTGFSSHKPLGPSQHPATHPVAHPPARPGLVRSATVPSKPSSHVDSRSTAQEIIDLRAPEPEQPTWNESCTTQRRPSAPARTGSHGTSTSVTSVSSVYTAAQGPAPPIPPFSAILISHMSRAAPGPSTILVTLRFGYSLDAEPNTHEVTVTLDTLRPAGGQLVSFVEQALRPNSLQSSSEGECTPPLSVEGPEMTDGSSAEDSDFEYDDTRFHPMLHVPATSRQERREDEEETLMMTREEYLVAGGQTSPSPSLKHSVGHGTPSRQPSSPALSRQASNASISRQASTSSLTRQPSNASISRKPSRRGLGPPPSAYPTSLGGFGTPLPPLSALPAALAQARAEREAAAVTANGGGGGTPPLVIRRPRSNTCPGPAVATITELTVLLQRDAGAWHIIASRLCSGSWPEMAGRRRRVEDECRWAGMDALLAELTQMPTLSRRGGFL